MTVIPTDINPWAPALDRRELTSWRLDSEGVELVRSLRRLAAVVGLTCGAASIAANVLDSLGSVTGIVIGILFPVLFVMLAELGNKAVALVAQRGQGGQVRLVRLGVCLVGLTAAVVSFNHVESVLSGHIRPAWFSWAAAAVIDIGAVTGLIGHHLASTQLKRHRIAVRVLADAAADDAAAAAAEARAEAERVAAEEQAAAELAAAEAEAEAARLAAEEQARAADAERRKARAKRTGKRTSAERVADALERDPHATQKEIAERLRLSESTVRRHWPRPALVAAGISDDDVVDAELIDDDTAAA